MEIAQYHRKVSLIASAGNVIPRATDSYAELGRLGAVITQFGLAIEQDRLKAEEYDQLTSAENQVNREYDELFNSLDPNDTDSWLEIIRKKSFDKTTELVTNTQAQAKWGPRLEAKRIQFERHVLSEKDVVDKRNYRQNYYLSFTNSIERAAKQESPGEFRQVLLGDIEVLQGLRLNEEGTKRLIAGTLEITPENFESLFESVEDYDNPMFKDYALRINEGKVLVKAAIEDKKKKFMEDQLAIALSLPDELGSIDKINTDDWPFDLDSDDIADMKTDYRVQKNAIDRQAEKELKATQDKNNRESWVKIRNGELTNPTIIENMVLNDNLTIEAGKSLIKQMGEGPAENSDNRALFETGQIINRVRENKTTADKGFEELQRYTTLLTENDMDTKINQLNSAERPDDPTMTPQAKRYFTLLQNLVMGKDKSPSNEKILFYDKAYQILSDYIKKNPDATPEELNKFYGNLVQPYIHDNLFFGWWGKQWKGLTEQLPETGKVAKDIKDMTDDELRAIIEGK